LAEKVPLVIEILAKQHRGSFFETPWLGGAMFGTLDLWLGGHTSLVSTRSVARSS